MSDRDQTALAQLIVRDTPVPRMAQQHVVPICGEGAMAAVPDRTVRHAEPTPGVVAVATVGNTRLAPPTVLLSVSAELTFVCHSRYYTGW